MKKRIISIVLTLTLCLGLLPTAALAAPAADVTDLSSALQNGSVEISQDGNYILSNVNISGHHITVKSNVKATLTLNNVSIIGSVTTVNDKPESAIDIENDAFLLLQLTDGSSNTLTGGSYQTSSAAPGIHVPENAKLAILGAGSLTVTGGSSNAASGGVGIGGTATPRPSEPGESCGTVVILASGNITITGGKGIDEGSAGVDIGGGNGPPNQDGDDGQGIRPVPGQTNTYEVWGELTLPEGVTIPEGAILTGDGSFAEGSKIEQSAPASAPTASEITDTSVTLNAVTGGKTQVHYAHVKGASDATPPTKDSQWDPKLTIPDLMAATAYTFYARYCETDFYKASPASDGLTVVTAPPPSAVSVNYKTERITFAEQNFEVSSDSNFSNLFQTNESISGCRAVYVRAKVDDGTQASIRGVTTVSLPPRPNYADGITAVNASAAGVNDGKIIGVSVDMEYREENTPTWTDCTGNVIEKLAPGTYYVRTKATENSFASIAKEVTIGVGNIITITLPTFDPVHTGYTQPDPKPIEICNSSDEDATIESVSCTGVVFKIQPEPTQDLLKIPAHGKDTHYALRPEPGMVAGEYTSPITVTYRDTNDNIHAVTATAHFTVLPQPTSGDDDCKHTNLVKTEAKPATHLEAGNKEYWYCADCNKYFSDEAGTKEITLESTVIPKLAEHTADDTGWHSDEANHWNICECGEVIDKEGHKFGEWTITKEATKTEAGSRTKSCTVCGYKVTESIPATGTTEPTDPPKPTDPDKENPDTGTTSPQTGDNSNFALWVSLLLASGGALTAVTVYSRKRRKTE